MNDQNDIDIDNLPFEEYAQVMAERGAAEFGDPNKAEAYPSRKSSRAT